MLSMRTVAVGKKVLAGSALGFGTAVGGRTVLEHRYLFLPGGNTVKNEAMETVSNVKTNPDEMLPKGDSNAMIEAAETASLKEISSAEESISETGFTTNFYDTFPLREFSEAGITANESETSSIASCDSGGFQWTYVSELAEGVDHVAVASPFEAEVALEAVKEIPLVSGALQDLSPEHQVRLIREVKSLVVDPSFVSCINSVIDKVNAVSPDTVRDVCDSNISESNKKRIILSIDEEQARWEALVAKHPCAFCMDLLSAPMVLTCSHSYCFHCLQESMKSCQSIEEGTQSAEVVQKCPTCKTEFKFKEAIFERNLQEAIAAEVAPFSKAVKEEWEQRLSTYQSFITRQKEEEEERRRKLEAGNEEAARARAEYDSYRNVAAQWVPILAFIVLIAIGTWRSSK